MEPQRPNIVLIISDDQGYRDFGFMNSPHLVTPNLDRLASEGMTFTHGFSTASVCRPALNTLLTGLHPVQWEARRRQLEREGVPLPFFREVQHFQTLPKLLKKANYDSFQAGKYWEGSPADGGFDDGMKRRNAPVPDNVIHTLAGGDSLKLARETMDPVWEFLSKQRSGPFFLWFAPMLPHRPHNPPERFRTHYRGRGLSSQALDYYATITWLDEAVGHLLDFLQERQLRRDTLIVFLVDNGRDQPANTRVAPAGGDRGKGSIYEFGYRTPIVFSYPDRIRAGRRSSALVSTVDVFATLVDYAGVPLPAHRKGISLRPTLEQDREFARERVIGGSERLTRLPPYVTSGEEGRRLPWPSEAAERAAQPAHFLRTAEWSYVWFPEAGVEELYAIEEDPRQTRNLTIKRPALAREFQEEIRNWLETMRAPYASP
jgi:uncharacterized sulfatase